MFGCSRARACRAHIGETDCMAGVVGLELRCAERKFISLTRRAVSHSSASAETAAVPRRMIFSVRLDCFLTAVAVSPTLGAAPQAISLRYIEVRILPPRQVGFKLRCAGRSFSSCKLRRGALFGSIQE